jgi:hypothetical protein
MGKQGGSCGLDRQNSKEVSKGDGVGDVGVVSRIGGELEVGERARLVSPLLSLSSLTSQRLFAAVLFFFAGGLSCSDGAVGACGCSGGAKAGTFGAEMVVVQ